MDISEATAIADAILYTSSGQQLSDVERLVLKGSLQKLRYKTISVQENHAHQFMKDVGFRLWRKLSVALDGEEVKKSNIRAVLERHRSMALSKVERNPQSKSPEANSTDWADAPEFEPFFGRQDELSTLKQWILQDRCRLIAIVGMRGIGKTGLTVRLGMGGIGKTNLSLQLVQGIQHKFDYVIWRSLLNAPSFDDTLRDLILFLSDQQETELPEMHDAKVLSLLGYLKRQRCLLILDNVESILVGHQCSSQDSLNQRSGLLSEQYRDGYENYGYLFEKVGEVAHKSCLLLTSREKPKIIESLASDGSKIRVFQLFGLKNEDAKKIFKRNEIGVQAESALESIIHFYEGNPLALKLVLKRIENVFGGNVTEFLEQDNPFFEDMGELLNWHFSRLSPVDQDIIYWLAINREPTSVATLKNDSISLGLGSTVPDTLALLQLRLPIIRTALGFTLQPVIIEYLNNKLVKLVCQEIQSGHINLLNRVCLQKGLAKAYVRESQKRFILLPIVNKLLEQYHHPSYITQQLNSILLIIRETPILSTGYATGNIISILNALGADLTGYDFSHLTIRQAYLQNISLKQVNFSYSDLSTVTFTQSFGGIHSAAFSSDGQYLALGDSKGQIRLLKNQDHQQIRLLTGHLSARWVTALAFSSTRPLLVSSSFDKTIKLWNPETGECIRTLIGHTHWLWSVDISPDSRLIASSGDDCTIRLWDTETGNCLHVLKDHSNWVWAIAFSPDGRILASGSYDHTVRLWDTETGSCLHVLRGHENSVWSLAFSPNGKILASGSLDHTVRLWDMDTECCIRTFIGHTKEVRSIAFTPDGESVISGSFDKTLKRWDVSTGRCTSTYIGHRTGIRTVTISPDGQTLASGDHGQDLRIWNLSTGQCIRATQGHSNWVWSVSIMPDQLTLASGSLDGLIRLWDLRTGRHIKTLEGHENWIWQVTFHPSRKMLASCCDDETIKLWDVSTAQCLKTLRGHSDGGVWAIDFSPNGKHLVSGGQDGRICFWDITAGKCTKVVEAHDNWIWSIVFNRQGSRFASCSDDGSIKIWNAETFEQQLALTSLDKVCTLAWLEDRNYLVSGHSDGSIVIRNSITGQLINAFEGHEAMVLDFAINPSNNTLISCSQDNTIKIWDLHTGKRLKIITDHQNWVVSVALSLEENIAITGSADGTVKIWDLGTYECLRTIKIPLPYDDMNITGAVGLEDGRKENLLSLGALST